MNSSFSNSIRTLLGILFLVLVGVVSFVLGRGLHMRQMAILQGGGYPVIGDAPIFPVIYDEPDPEPEYVDPGVQTSLSIAWLPFDQQDDISQEIPWQVEQYFYDVDVSWDPTNPAFVRELGVVSSGEYEGSTLLYYGIPVEGMGVYYNNVYVLRPPGSAAMDNETPWRLLLRPTAVDRLEWSTMDQALEDLSAFYAGKYGVDIDVTTEIPELAFSQKIVQTADGIRFVAYKVHSGWPTRSSADDYPIRATLEDGTVLRLAGDNSLFSVRKDGRRISYDVVIPFWDGVDMPNPSRHSAIPSVVLNGKTNETTYLKGKAGGCGFENLTNVVSLDEVGELELIGYFVEGERKDIFAPKDLSLPYFEGAFTAWKSGDEVRTLEQFRATIPFFYYQDALGRWVEFANAEVVPAGECGKPVIYLYPETTTDLRVEVAPQGGFTFTEPAYNGGWNVTAEPDGTLTNHPDGKTYPYLFWEGRGAMYEKPLRYWVVAQADVHTFLVTTLAKLSLNEKESADFIEFWEPRMQDSPYYRVGFHGTETMDEIAPLTISQTPDSILRILMDFDGLEVWEPSNPPQRLPSFERKGFTVVEWGGVIQ